MTSAGSSLPPLRTAGLVPGAAGTAAGSRGPRGGGACLPDCGPELSVEVESAAVRGGRVAPASTQLPTKLGPSRDAAQDQTLPPKGGSSICRATCRNRHARIFGAEVCPTGRPNF